MLVIYNYFGISVSRYRVKNVVYSEGKIFGICENVRGIGAWALINTLLFVLQANMLDFSFMRGFT